MSSAVHRTVNKLHQVDQNDDVISDRMKLSMPNLVMRIGQTSATTAAIYGRRGLVSFDIRMYSWSFKNQETTREKQCILIKETSLKL